MASVQGSGRAAAAATTPGAGTPLAGDVLVLLTTTDSTTPALPSSVSGCGATWANVHAGARASVWVGTDATSIGLITATGGTTNAVAAWWLRDVSTQVTATEHTGVGPITMTADPQTVGSTQAALALSRPSDALPDTGSLPSTGAWTAAQAGTTKSAWAVPSTSDTYSIKSTRTTANRTVLVQAVIGTPPPAAPTGLATTPGPDSIELDWTAGSGGAPSYYEVRLDGGAETNVGNVLTHTFTGLDAATGYLLEVRAGNAGGVSAWASIGEDTTAPPPTGLNATTAGLNSVDLAWTAPALGGPVGHYEVRVDGGTPDNVGTVTAWTMDGLPEATTFFFEVRSVYAAFASPWVGVFGSTESPPPTGDGYTAHLRVGDHSWDIASTDVALYGPTADVRFGWTARQDDGWPTQHEPTILSFGVVVAEGTDFDDVDQGTVVHFTFTPDGYAAPLVEFGGTVRDLEATPAEVGMLYRMVAVDHLQKLQEDYVTSGVFVDGDPTANIWPTLLQDALGAGMGVGTRPALPDPAAATDYPFEGSVGTVGPDGLYYADANTWEVLTGITAAMTTRLGATPPEQRMILTYQLDPLGDLDTSQPFVGTWATHDPTATVPIDGGLLPTGSVVWSRPRIEPNVFVDTIDGSDFTYERTHTGADVVRRQTRTPNVVDGSDPWWVLAGVEGVNQWSTNLEVLADLSPEVVEGWFTLPAAMGTFIECTGIDPRHTPDGSGNYLGFLAGAALAIRPGGTWSVAFALRRTLPPAP